MIGIFVPVNNEEKTLWRCLQRLHASAAHPSLRGESVLIVVVLDTCTDASAEIALRAGVRMIAISARNVGVARDTGARHLCEAGARWIACTDADSYVSDDWLVQQLLLKAELVCGTVQVDDWQHIPGDIQRLYERDYHAKEEHRHIHGANLGFSASLYGRTNGFGGLPADEDVYFVRQCEEADAKIAWSNHPRVYTSARLEGRTNGGFAGYLQSLVSHRTALRLH